MRISVFGCGYLGAVHAACMTRLGHDVVMAPVYSAGEDPIEGFGKLLKMPLPR